MKLIFLDFDGVLNSDKFFASKKFKQEYSASLPYTQIDPVKVKLLNSLVDKSGASVIVSSAWRVLHSIDELNYFLKKRGATFELVDSTPILQKDCDAPLIPRGEEIQRYLNSICIKPNSLVIIDDHDDMLHLTPYLVQTYYEIGITKNNISDALMMLEKEYL